MIKETINRRDYYTVQTDEKGELTADLTEGLYKAVEVEAPEQYDIENQTYYFGIGASREAPEKLVLTQVQSIGGSNDDYIESVAETSDGGYIAGGYFYSSTIQVGNETLTNNSDISSNGYYYPDGLIIKYNSEGEVEWAKNIGGSYNDYIQSVASTSDGGIIVGGYFASSTIQVGNETLTNNSIYYYAGLIIKYSAEGEVEWTKNIGESNGGTIESVASTTDGGIIAGGYFRGTIQVENETLTNNGVYDGLIIKYSAKGDVEWAKNVGGSYTDEITSVVSTSDGGIIAGGYFASSTIQVGNETLTNNSDISSNGYYNDDGLIIKYSRTGDVEWANNIGGSSTDHIESVASTSDGGYIAGGYFYSDSIQVGDKTLTSNGGSDGLIIKYNSEGEVKWAKNIGGSNSDHIYSVATTSDGGIIVGGYFLSSTIQFENETLTNHSSSNDDGLIIKYNSEGEVEWAKNIGGSNSDEITSVASTSDGGYIAGGEFSSSTINIGDKTLTNITKNGIKKDGMIIKYEMQEQPNPVVTNAKVIGGSNSDHIYSVATTSDGGYIAGGYFDGRTIQVGNETLINNSLYVQEYDGLIIKYNSEGGVEWAKNIGGAYNDYIYSVASTSDGGAIAGGYFQSTIQVGNETLISNGGTDGLIIKYSSTGEVEWVKSFGGSDSDSINSVVATSDGGYIAGGDFNSNSIQVGNETLTNSGSTDGIIIKYNADGEIEWANSFSGEQEDYIKSVTETNDDGYIAGGYFNSKTVQVGNEILTNNGSNGDDGFIIKYSSKGKVEWTKSIGAIEKGWNERILAVAPTSDGGILAGGSFSNSTLQVGNETLTNNSKIGSSDGLIIKYSEKGEVEWAKNIGGRDSETILSVVETSDKGYIVGGEFESSTVQVGNEILTNNGYDLSRDYTDGLIIKYNSSGKVEWVKNIGGSSDDKIQSVAEASDGGYIAGGYFYSDTIEVDGHTLTNNGRYDGMIVEVVNQVGVPEVQELTVENSRKEFKITTDVKEIDGVKGGSISGERMNPYEKVKYGDNSTKEIVMTPEENYEIIGITVNGEEWPFEEAEDGTYTMPAFENMTEDKHVEVTYSLKDNKIIIKR